MQPECDRVYTSGQWAKGDALEGAQKASGPLPWLFKHGLRAAVDVRPHDLAAPLALLFVARRGPFWNLTLFTVGRMRPGMGPDDHESTPEERRLLATMPASSRITWTECVS